MGTILFAPVRIFIDFELRAVAVELRNVH